MEIPEQILMQTANAIFESMTFTSTQPQSGENPEPSPLVRARIRYAGPFRGSAGLTLPESMLPELTRNMLGDDDGALPSRSEQWDVLGELLNVMTGNILNAIAGPDPIFDLDAPEVAANSEPGAEADFKPFSTAINQKSVRLWFENGWAEIGLSIDE